ncbi:DUF4304 domain-containing protein [Paucibacter sp. DJ1R-11]|nr:DUF4304 domain-containing protein [Paucibacter sp. DJ1R-11]
MNEAAPPRLELALKQHLAPLLRSDGFSGTGRTFRRVRDGWIQVIGVQGSRHGGQFAINLGLQPLSVAHVLGELPDPKKITDSLCEFRRRLTADGSDQWWSHGQSQESMNQAAEQAAAVYVTVGRKLLASVSGPQSPFEQISPEVFARSTESFVGFGSTRVRMALVLSLLRRSQHRFSESAAFAEIGLGDVGSAAGLRPKLEELAAGK